MRKRAKARRLACGQHEGRADVLVQAIVIRKLRLTCRHGWMRYRYTQEHSTESGVVVAEAKRDNAPASCLTLPYKSAAQEARDRSRDRGSTLLAVLGSAAHLAEICSP